MNLWTCQLVNCLIYELWNDLNIFNILYMDLEYNDFFFDEQKFEQINIKLFLKY